MLYILKHNSVLKMNLCWNADSKSVYGGTKPPVSISDEKVHANQAFIFSICINLFLTTKNSLFTSNIDYLWNAIDFDSVV